MACDHILRRLSFVAGTDSYGFPVVIPIDLETGSAIGNVVSVETTYDVEGATLMTLTVRVLDCANSSQDPQPAPE